MSINRAGVESARERSKISQAVRAQLELVAEWAADYVSNEGQMPHEWGSLDTYDDMRNAMVVAGELLAEAMFSSEDEVEVLRRACREGGLCAVAPAVAALAFADMTENQMDEYLYGRS